MSRRVTNDMKLQKIKPITTLQESAFQDFFSGSNLVLHGVAGTGKSFISLFLAMNEIEKNRSLNKVAILRSVVPGRDIGFLPGSLDEKIRVYEEPYYQIFSKLYGRGDAYEILKKHDVVEFATTSFLRGITFENCVVVVDEIQNMCYSELLTIITRIGDNCRIILCGDYRQTDLVKEKEREGLHHFMNIIARMQEFAVTEFGIADIVRSGFVKSFIMHELEYRAKHSF